jgi:hypothetical protein
VEGPSGRRGGLARSLGVVEWSAGVVLVAGMVAVPSHPVAGWSTRRGAPLCRAQCPFVGPQRCWRDRLDYAVACASTSGPLWRGGLESRGLIGPPMWVGLRLGPASVKYGLGYRGAIRVAAMARRPRRPRRSHRCPRLPDYREDPRTIVCPNNFRRDGRGMIGAPATLRLVGLEAQHRHSPHRTTDPARLLPKTA